MWKCLSEGNDAVSLPLYQVRGQVCAATASEWGLQSRTEARVFG
jgi:hypothetical protein